MHTAFSPGRTASVVAERTLSVVVAGFCGRGFLHTHYHSIFTMERENGRKKEEEEAEERRGEEALPSGGVGVVRKEEGTGVMLRVEEKNS